MSKLSSVEAEERARHRDDAIFNQPAVGIAEVAPDGSFIRVNDRYCEITGYDRNELQDMSFEDVTHPDFLKEDLKRNERLLAGEIRRHREEKQYIRKDGKLLWVEVFVSAVFDEDGEPDYFVGIVQDIDKRKRAERNLEERVKELNALHHIWREAEQAREDDISGILQRSLSILPESWQYPEVTCARILADGEEYATEDFRQTGWCQSEPIRVHGEEYGTVQVCYLEERPEEDEGPFLIWERHLLESIASALGAIIERETAREDIDRARRRYERLVTNVPQVVYSAEPRRDRQMIFISHRWQEWTGTDPDRLEDATQAWSMCVHPGDRERVLEQYDQAVAAEEDFECEYRLITDAGEQTLIVHDHAKPQIRSDGSIRQYDGIITDITRRREAEEELQRTMAELERSNRELQDFAYVASHDLQEPLRKVMQFGQRLQSACEGRVPEKGEQYLSFMLSGAERMGDLIDGLLQYSRVTTHASEHRPVDLNAIVRDVITDLSARIEQTGGTVEVSDLAEVEAEPLQMRRLLQNLISNALKYHREGVAPVVEVASKQIAAEESLIDGPAVEISVTDNGIGFDEKYLERIFEVFQRLHLREEYEGTGIGLALCRKIVHRHDGEITATSTPGEGTTFKVQLPSSDTEGVG